jgi:tartrate-resistant acid phosphatase type 5
MTEYPKRLSIERSCILTMLLLLLLFAAPFACNHQEVASAGDNPSTSPAKTVTSKPATKIASKPAPNPASKPIIAKWSARPFPTDQVNFIVFGDFGNGKPSQKDNAKTMANYVQRTGLQFNASLTVGDNFYVKMKNVDDWQFQALFEDMYDAKRLNFPYFATSGNHDFEKADNGKTKVELEQEYSALHPDSRWKYPSRWYRLDFPQGAKTPLVTALMLDSSMPRMTPAQWEEEKQWIDEQLGQSTARWKIACAHHPFFSNGSHGDNGVMQLEWGPIFKKHHLDMYVAGHDHDLQHLQVNGWPFSFVQAGGGGQPITDMRRDIRGPFSRKIYGFIHLHFEQDSADVRYVASPDAKIIHHFQRQKESGAITIVTSTPRDKATTKPLKTLLGISESDIKPPEKK